MPTGRYQQLALSSVIAIAFMAVLYPYTFRAWFQADDLGWLGLGQHLVTFDDWLGAMFAPLAQGTIRPLSERMFYLAASKLFGLNALPYRIIIFVLQAANLAMLGVVARRLLQSAWASVWAPLLWISNIALAALMTWTGSCSEVFCALFLLGAFYCLLLFIATNAVRYAVAHWVFYLLAMGALEVTVMYPVAATAYVWLFSRRYLKQVAAMFGPAVIYTVVHEAVRHAPKTHVYDLHFDGSMVTTFATYVHLALGPGAARETFSTLPAVAAVAATVVIATGLLVFVWTQWKAGDRVPLFGVIWFLAFLGPFLPVRDHITNYYLTIPCIGLALTATSAVLAMARGGLFYRAVAVACLLLYLGFSIPTTRADSKAWWARAVPVKKLVLGVRDVHRAVPGKLILLDGVADQLFWMAVYDHPFRLFGADVYLTTDAGAKLHPYPELANIADYTMPRERMNEALRADRAVVYSAGGDAGELRDITAIFKSAALDNATPRRVDLGHPAIESLLGTGWYPSEGDYRWMPAEGSVRLGNTDKSGILRVTGACAAVQLPLTVSASIDGRALEPAFQVKTCDGPLTIEWPFAASKSEVEVRLRVNHTVHVGQDTRELGLAVRTIEVIP